MPRLLETGLSSFENSLLRGEVVREHTCSLGCQTIGAPAIICFESSNQSPALKSSKQLVKRARRDVDTGELFDVLHEGITVLVAAREAGEHEYSSAGVSSESYQCVF